MEPRIAAAAVIEAFMGIAKGDNAYRAKFAAGCVDALIGTDPQAVLQHIPGLSPEMTETLSDALIGALEQAILDRLNA
ncbi:MAG TPA: hypothetical protein VFB99_03855 [Vicinamibacterales bacterium]|nr:hypothetical protein [Vicinamibacterales bacterium]